MCDKICERVNRCQTGKPYRIHPDSFTFKFHEDGTFAEHLCVLVWQPGKELEHIRTRRKKLFLSRTLKARFCKSSIVLAKVMYSTGIDLTTSWRRSRQNKCQDMPSLSAAEIGSTCATQFNKVNNCQQQRFRRNRHDMVLNLRFGLLPLQYKTWWSCLVSRMFTVRFAEHEKTVSKWLQAPKWSMAVLHKLEIASFLRSRSAIGSRCWLSSFVDNS